MALGVAPVQDGKYLVCRLKHSSELMFIRLVENLVEEGPQAKKNMHEKSQMTVDVYDDE